MTNARFGLRYCTTYFIHTAFNSIAYCLGQNRKPFPSIPHHPGLTTADLFLAKQASDCTEFANQISKATTLALENNSDKCSLYFGQIKALVIFHPNDLKKLWLEHETKLNGEESVALFKRAYGPKNIMAQPTGTVWRTIRVPFTSQLFDKAAMIKNTKTIQQLLDFYIKKIASNDMINLEELANNFTLDMIIKGLIKAEKVSDMTKNKLSKLIATGVDSAVKLKQVALLNLQDYTGKFPIESDSMVAEAEKIIRNEIINPNKESLVSTENWLTNKISNEKNLSGEDLKIDSQELIKETAFLLTAGHDTTAKHFIFTFMLVTQHKEVLNKIIEEIKLLNKPPQDWTDEDIKKLHYLDCVSLESLRLCPPLPIQKVKVSKQFTLSDGITLKPGDHIFMNIGATHRLKEIYKNPDDFMPERFLDQKPEQFISQTLDKTNPYYFAWMPFGTGARSCPGRRMAIQEVKMAIAYFAYFFEMTLQKKWSPSQTKITFGLHPDLKEPPMLSIKAKSR